MFKGRKVSDPIVHGTTGGTASGTNRYNGDRDLDRAWNNIGKAKSELRKIEHRLGDVDHRPHLNETGETSITEYPSLDQTYSKTEFPSGAVVDKYGRSAYMRSKAHTGGAADGTRKISRMDDKYREDNDTAAHGSNHNHRGDRRTERDKKSLDRQGRGATGSPKRVDFHEHNEMREVNLDGTYTDLAVGSASNTGPVVDSSSFSQGNITDSVALRNTEIRFINEHQSERTGNDLRWNGRAPFTAFNTNMPPPSSGGSKFTHVSVTVPGSTRATSSVGVAGGATNKVPGALSSALASPIQTRDAHNDRGASDLDRRWEVGSTDSAQSDDRPFSRRFKGSIRDIDSDGLAKLKEKIRKQQEKSSSPVPPEARNPMEGTALETGPRHTLHLDHEPIEQRTYELLLPPDGANSKQPKVRKVAAGPPLPSYKGFSETEVRYKHTEPKPVKTHDIRKKEKRKKTSFKLQEKKPEFFDDGREDKVADKPKKMTRVIASSSRKPGKQEVQKKEIITTSSWRAGQELVLRELGPVKVRRTSQTSQTSDLPEQAMHAADIEDEQDADFQMQDFEANKEHASSTAAELERARVLSEEARRVLSDLNYGSEDDDDKGKHGDGARHRSHKSATKRKARSTDLEKQQPMAKHRHYDAQEVRRYIQQQKRARLRQQREDEQKQKEADKIKRKQLEELYNKQKQSAVTSASHNKKVKDVPEGRDGRRSRHRVDETFIHPAGLADLPQHHPFHENRQRMVVSSESEKENRGVNHIEEDMSDDSSTITGDSMEEETTETATPRVEAEKTKVKFTGKTSDKDSETVPNKFSVDGENNIRNVGGFTFNVEGVMSKFSQALHNKGEQLPSNSGLGGSVPSTNNEGAAELQRTRADRIQAIKATAATLQSRIQAEARKITGHDEGSAANPNPNSRWALPPAGGGGAKENDAFVSRYERMIGTDTNYSVFAANLPGAQQASQGDPQGGLDDSSIEPEAAAIRIQAAYRGHTVRQSLTWKLPSGRTMLASHRDEDEDESSISETSTFSDITITEDSENSMSSPPRKIGAGLRDRDFHAGAKRSRPSQEMHIPRPQGQTAKYSWEDPTSDPYSVLNVFARQKRNQVKQRQGPVGEESHVPKSRATIPVKEDEVKRDKTTSQQTAPKPAARSGVKDTRSRSPGMGYRQESSHPVITGLRTSNFASITESLKNKPEVNQTKTASVSFQVGTEKSDDDTLEEDSYLKTADSGDDRKHKPYKYEKKPIKPQPKSSSVKSVRKERSGSDRGHKEGSESDVSLETDRPSYSLHRPSYDASQETGLKFPSRYSPNSLERQFHTELNQLESMEESMRQLTNMERTRAVSMAQQETVSLAQMLKARQQEHSKDMSVLELKAQREMLDATKELNDVRQRSMEVTQTAAEAITRLRSVPTDTKQKTGRKVTVDPRSRSEVTSLLVTDNIRPRKNKMTTSAVESERGVLDSARTATSYTVDSRTGRSRGVITPNSLRTASDTHKNGDSDSSIRSVSGAEARDESRSESIIEDISQASGDDYSVIFDDTMTEDEMEEKSFKAILPSESHRKRAKKHSGDNMSVTSDEGSISSVPNTPRMTLNDLSSFFTGEESFNKFTEDMVRQFMREEELRAQHQGALLRLREKALTEKTKAELAWLDQQRHNLRNKGADDNYPQIIKRQRGLKMRLQEQQAEIKRLQESNKAASLERQRLLKQHTEISRMRKNTQKTKEKLKGNGRLERPSEVHTEDEVSTFDDHKDGASGRKKKDYKSDSEIYTEPKVTHKKSMDDSTALDKLKKIHFDERFLTAREQKLLDRRKNAEELLRWKQRLDHEESRVFKIEQKAIKIWDTQDNRRPEKTPAKDDRRLAKTQAKTVKDDQTDNTKVRQRNDPKESQTASTAQESTIASASVLTAKDESVRRSVTETPRTEIASGSESSPEERLRERDNKDRTANSGSESSIVEEIASISSVDEGSPATPRVRKSRSSAADDTIINDSQYNNDSFEETSVQVTSSKRSGKSPRSPLDRLPQGMLWLSGRTVRHGNRSPFSRYRSSESESEESISHTESYTETQSDFSDYEGRVRALNEELKRRKVEADRLKKERKKRKKEILKNKEVALKKQIEAYDNQIVQLKAELQKEMEHEPVKSSVRPQIKQPKVSPPKSRPQQEVTTPTKKGSTSSISEDSKEGTDSAQSSPSITEDTKQSSPTQKTAPSMPLTKAGSLEKISEASESTISRSRSDNTTRRVLSKPFSNDEASIKTEISEDFDQAAEDSVSERSKSGLFHITKELPPLTAPKSTASVSRVDEDEASYTEDFTVDDGVSASVKLPHSARSDVSDHTEHKQRTVTDNMSEQISEALSVRSEDSHFIQPLDLQGRQEQPDDGYPDQKSPRSYSTTASRPSSGRSLSSQDPNESFDDSDVEPSQTSSVPQVQGDLPSRSGEIGFEDEEEIDDEEETPTASPRDAPTKEMDIMGDFNIGDRVLVTGPRGARSPGILLFKGKVTFAPGIWAGVELEAADGRNDGSHEGIRYFTCHPGHGVLVPGDDLMPAPAIRSPRREGFSSHDDDSITTDDQEDSDLSKVISEAEINVSNFSDGLPSPRAPIDRSQHQKEALTDTITDHILAEVVRDDMNTINRIQGRKTAPSAVAQEPSNRLEVPQPGANTPHMNGSVDSDGERDINQNDKRSQMTEKLTKNLLNDAIDDMITIRNKQRNRQDPLRSGYQDQVFSPTQEIEHVWGRGSQGEKPDNPPRPVSPLPGSTSRATKEGNKELDEGLNDLLFDDKVDEYIDDEIISSPKMNQPPPPYPGLQPELITDTGNLDFQQIQEEVFFAVPHERHEIEEVVSSAVDVFWNQRRYGESLEGLEPPDTYYSTEDNNNDVDSKSRRVFEKLLFDSTGDIIRDIYKEEDQDTTCAWKQTKRTRQKYYRGANPPTTIDVLKPIVQKAVIEILGLNGSRKVDKNRWSVRKKKDHVDNILVEELREEEPDWVNYDDDETAVKMQLTEAIFETLLTDTVQTMNKIYRKKQMLSQQQQ
ncbi:centrosome-associated protein 350-like isoform X1 [Mizuhopecten yessoensis]|uniref:centrosome-associated protein 350-like isoform X1 n=3 Tax=Mizuhopecten yessoensis TaxID=6573 RepID=UPI000B45C67F|nr:centrosome-associated protein 350-like isoform X1 [Mizuhopecten yessoensis]XP_021341746.1 centrosome-associated protein 350-like isoform X1 [Mizuhopecten yessoensis]